MNALNVLYSNAHTTVKIRITVLWIVLQSGHMNSIRQRIPAQIVNLLNAANGIGRKNVIEGCFYRIFLFNYKSWRFLAIRC